MSRITKAAGAVLVGVLALIGSACGNGTPVGAPNDPAPTPDVRLVEEGEWTIEIPEGWTRRVITKDADAEKAVRYEGPNGEYFIVAIDPTGSDFTYDALWHYEVSGNRFEVADKDECVGKNDEHCADDDDRYDAYIMWPSEGEPQKVGGHQWYFIFGDADSTTVDEDLTQSIFESIRVTA